MTTLHVLTLLLNKFRVSLAMSGLGPGMLVGLLFCWRRGLAKAGETAHSSWVEGLARCPGLKQHLWDLEQREGRILGDSCV